MASSKASQYCISAWALIFKPMKRGAKIFLFCFCCFAFIGCDRVTKDAAKEHLKNKEAASYFHDTIRLQYVENTGAALNLGDDLPKTISLILLSLIPLALLLILSGYTIKNSRDIQPLKIFLLSMIVAGGIGNIIDRIFNDRHVPDFINIGINNLRTGIFNVADVCVTMGVIGLILVYRNKFLPGIVKE
jgi:signal peptidase II